MSVVVVVPGSGLSIPAVTADMTWLIICGMPLTFTVSVPLPATEIQDFMVEAIPVAARDETPLSAAGVVTLIADGILSLATDVSENPTPADEVVVLFEADITL